MTEELTNTELIRAVAEEVMGWRWENGIYLKSDGRAFYDGVFGISFDPLNNTNHRDMVVERMIGLGFDVKLQYYCDDTEGWQVKFINPKEEIETLDAIMKEANEGDKKSFELALEARKQYTDIKTRWHINKKIGRAVCEAALAAVRGNNVEKN